MSKKLRFIWIDDDPDREEEAENVKSRLNVEVEFKNVKNKRLIDELDNLLSKEKPPDLILMDHMLNNVEVSGFKTGSTAAEYIREKEGWRECPIICITGVPLSSDIFDFHRKSIYEHVFEISKISNFYSSFLSIAESSKLLRHNRPQNIDDLIKLLNVPVDEEKRLRDILPEDLKSEDSYNDKSLIIRISKWVRRTLMEKPGFLYDKLWTATLLGIKEVSFTKVEDLFIEAKYNGIFADKGNNRWWQTRLREILFSKFPDRDTIYPWALGRELPEITESDFSKCYTSGEDFPETVAFTDATAQKREPMRLRYTIPYPNFEKSLYFEEIRMMKAAE